MLAYLEDAFLDRVRRTYRLALTAAAGRPVGSIWSPIDARRADIHAALLDENNDGLREIFANPTATDLFYGCDGLCRSLGGQIAPEAFTEAAIAGGRGRFAAYQTECIAALLGEADASSVVEIGPGMGRVAFFAYSMGITDYTTIDLPLGIVAQTCFLSRALGPDKLWLAGEAEQFAAGRIKLFFAGQRPARRYAVALNVDSMTEMPSRDAFDYASWLNEHAQIFLSINHPKNAFTVAELMRFAGMKRARKSSLPPNEGYADVGYFEEVYLPKERPRSSAYTRREAFRIYVGLRQRLRYCAALMQSGVTR
jgi:hypothetical protein